MATLNNSEIRQRIDTEANWNTNNPTLASGELALSSDKYDMKVGDGSTWRNTNYMIANNATVQSINTKATNAQTTANSAASTASTALTRANQALANGGRTANARLLTDYVSGGDLMVNDEFVNTKYKNFDLNCTKGMTGFNINIQNFEIKADTANEIVFNFVTNGTCSVKCTRMTKTISEVDGGNKLLLVTKGDGISAIDINNYVNITPGAFARVRLIDNWILEVEAIKF